ncbi:MAG: transglycosylase SLT domain-containing protein [Bradymonadia bacterium]
MRISAVRRPLVALSALAFVVGLSACGAHAAPPKRVLTAAELAPISLGPKDAEVRDLIARQQYAEAARKITAKGPGPRAAQGWLWLEARAHERALKALEGVPEALPALADQARLWQTQAYTALNDYERALATAKKVSPGGPFRWMARRYMAKALRKLERYEEAHQVYDTLIEGGRGGDQAVGLLGKAMVFSDEELPEDAIPHLRRLHVEHSTHWAAKEGAQIAERIITARPDLAPDWNRLEPNERLKRGEKLLKVHRNTEVVEALAGLSPKALTDETACQVQYTLGRALRKLRKYSEALPQFTAAVKSCAAAESDLLPWSRYRLALLEERMAKEDEAGNSFKALMEKHPDHRLGDDGGFYLVKHLLDDKKDPEAAERVARRLVARFPEGDMVSEALFFTVMSAIKRKAYDDALSLLALQERLPPEPTHKHGVAGRAKYWWARVQQLKGNRKAATEGYSAVIQDYPLSWYGALAYSRLRALGKTKARRTMRDALRAVKRAPAGLPGVRPVKGAPGGVEIPAGLDPQVAQRAVLLARLGLAELAWSALKGEAKGDNMLWFSAKVLHSAGAWRISHNILRRQLNAWQRVSPAGPFRQHWEMGYPQAFGPLVQKAAKEVGIDPFFVWAIMREESGFNPAVQSFANAFGLMQLIMPTAKSMRKKGEKAITRTSLRDPEVNVRLGTRYLAHIGDRVRDTLPLLPSGYNAGPGALKRWLKARGKLPLDMWVELIPFEETRWYTRSVVGSWIIYSALYGENGKDPIPVISMGLPKYGKKG